MWMFWVGEERAGEGCVGACGEGDKLDERRARGEELDVLEGSTLVRQSGWALKIEIQACSFGCGVIPEEESTYVECQI